MRHIPLLALLVAGCGGSSSETPPPLEPDPTSYRYSGPRLPALPDATPAEPEPEPEVDEDDLPASKKKPAAATWGSGRPAPRASAAPSAAPSMTPLPAPPPSAAPAPAALPVK